jgi:hypothetical protein
MGHEARTRGRRASPTLGRRPKAGGQITPLDAKDRTSDYKDYILFGLTLVLVLQESMLGSVLPSTKDLNAMYDK